MSQTKLAGLVRDFTLYPRHHVLEFNVQSIMRALKAGSWMPPVIADRKTKKVVDGFNRCEAIGRLYGESADIAVEWRDYRDKAAMFEDAMLLNSSHGEKLNAYDMARCTIIAEQLGIQRERLAMCLGATVDWIDKLQHRKVAKGPDGPIPLKGTVTQWAKAQNAIAASGGESKPLTQRQVQANDGTSGPSWWFLLDKTIHLFRFGLVPFNEKALSRVEKLLELTSAWLEKEKTKVA